MPTTAEMDTEALSGDYDRNNGRIKLGLASRSGGSSTIGGAVNRGRGGSRLGVDNTSLTDAPHRQVPIVTTPATLGNGN